MALSRIIYFLFFILFSGQQLHSIQPDTYILSHTDKNKITIGDKLKLTIVLEYQKGLKFDTFNPEENLKNFEIKDCKVSKEKKKYFVFGRCVKKYEYILSTFTTGIYEIPPFTLKSTDKDGKTIQIQTNLIKIEVTSLLDKESALDIRDIKPPVNLKLKVIFYVIFIGILVLLLAGYYIYRNYFQKKDFQSIINEIVDPYKYAMDELSKLEDMDLIKKGMVKEFFINLTQIIRIYLSKIFSVNIIDMTTSESLRALREKDVDRKFLLILHKFFECADFVKFAKYVPEEKEIILNFETAKEIVEMIRPIADDKVADTKNSVELQKQ
ncbi:MAG: BatD family protein [Elusimicrobiota bacterium]